MANFVSLDNSIPEVGSSSGAERMTHSRARRNREERAATREAATLARRTARARQSQGERAATREADTLARRTAQFAVVNSHAYSIPVMCYTLH